MNKQNQCNCEKGTCDCERCRCVKNKNRWCGNSRTDAVYGVGLIGALVYYVQHSDSLWLFFVAIFKAILWPAFVVYDVLQYIGMK